MKMIEILSIKNKTECFTFLNKALEKIDQRNIETVNRIADTYLKKNPELYDFFVNSGSEMISYIEDERRLTQKPINVYGFMFNDYKVFVSWFTDGKEKDGLFKSPLYEFSAQLISVNDKRPFRNCSVNYSIEIDKDKYEELLKQSRNLLKRYLESTQKEEE